MGRLPPSQTDGRWQPASVPAVPICGPDSCSHFGEGEGWAHRAEPSPPLPPHAHSHWPPCPVPLGWGPARGSHRRGGRPWGRAAGRAGPAPVPSARPAAQGLTRRGWRAHPRGHMCFLADAGAEQGGGRLAAGAGGLVMNHVVPPAARSPAGDGADSPGRRERFQSSPAWPAEAAAGPVRPPLSRCLWGTQSPGLCPRRPAAGGKEAGLRWAGAPATPGPRAVQPGDVRGAARSGLNFWSSGG